MILDLDDELHDLNRFEGKVGNEIRVRGNRRRFEKLRGEQLRERGDDVGLASGQVQYLCE